MQKPVSRFEAVVATPGLANVVRVDKAAEMLIDGSPSEEAETGDNVHSAEESGICDGLARLPAKVHLDTAALARILHRSKKSVQRAVRRGELPAPFKFLGRHCWLAGVIVEHLTARQEAALRELEKHARSRARHNIQ